MKEKDFQTRFTRWLKNRFPETAAFELKITKSKSLAFNKVAPHQERALWAAKHECLTHKIGDFGATNPFDCFQLCRVPAFVVVMFYEKRGEKEFIMIDIDDWLVEKEISDRKSLTRERAEEIGEPYFFPSASL